MALLASCAAAERVALVTDSRVQFSDGRVVRENSSGAVHVCAAFSPSGALFCVSDDAKNLFVYNAATLALVRTLWVREKKDICEKRLSALVFTRDESHIVVADKSGDVYLFDLALGDEEVQHGKLIAGHVSMLLDVVLSVDERFVIACDRDEKIRVTSFRGAYEIQSFCLAHTEMVTTLAVVDNAPTHLLSGAADGTVRLWNFVDGQLLATASLGDHLPLSDADTAVVLKVVYLPSASTAAVIAAQCPSVLLLHVTTHTLNFSQVVDIGTQPWSLAVCGGKFWVSAASGQPIITLSGADSAWKAAPAHLTNPIPDLGQACSAVQQATTSSVNAVDRTYIYFTRKEKRLAGKRAGARAEEPSGKKATLEE